MGILKWQRHSIHLFDSDDESEVGAGEISMERERKRETSKFLLYSYQLFVGINVAPIEKLLTKKKKWETYSQINLIE